MPKKPESKPAEPPRNSIAGDQLKGIIERIERMEEEKSGVATDIKEIYAEAKGNGFDTKIIRRIVKARKRDRTEIENENAVFALYADALGMSFPK